MPLENGLTAGNCTTSKADVAIGIEIANRLDVTALTTNTAGQITAYTMAATKVFFDLSTFIDDGFVVNFAGSDENATGNAVFTDGFTVKLRGMDQPTINFINSCYSSNPCGFVAVLKMSSGKRLNVGCHPAFMSTIRGSLKLRSNATQGSTGALNDNSTQDLVFSVNAPFTVTELATATTVPK